MYGDEKKKTWTYYLIKEFLSFSKKSVIDGIFYSNHHLLILNDHGSQCNFGNSRASITIWVGHVHITFSHLSCHVTLQCELLQTFQNSL
jgi:hypothetical protein